MQINVLMFTVELETAVVLLSVVGTFLGCLAVGLEVLRRIAPPPRLQEVRRRRESLRRQEEQKEKESASARQRKKTGWVQKVLARIGSRAVDKGAELNRMLAKAGWRDRTEFFILLHVVCVAVFGGAAAIFAYKAKGKFHIPEGAMRPMVVFAACALGASMPWVLLKNQVVKRQHLLSRQFPDALDLLLVCVEAGLSVDAAFLRVTEEIDETAPEVALEMGLTGAELAFLGNRRQAYENLAERTGMQEFKSLSVTLAQSERYGTPVASSLRVLSEESRRTRVVTVEKKAAALPAKLTVPMIAFFLPVLLLIIVGPAMMQAFKL